VLLPTLTPILTSRPAACHLLCFRIWLSGEVAAYLAYSTMVGGDSLFAGLLPPPDDSAVTVDRTDRVVAITHANKLKIMS